MIMHDPFPIISIHLSCLSGTFDSSLEPYESYVVPHVWNLCRIRMHSESFMIRCAPRVVWHDKVASHPLQSVDTWNTLWWTNILQWKITIFHGKIHYFNGHVQLLFVCSPEGIPACYVVWLDAKSQWVKRFGSHEPNRASLEPWPAWPKTGGSSSQRKIMKGLVWVTACRNITKDHLMKLTSGLRRWLWSWSYPDHILIIWPWNSSYFPSIFPAFFDDSWCRNSKCFHGTIHRPSAPLPRPRWWSIALKLSCWWHIALGATMLTCTEAKPLTTSNQKAVIKRRALLFQINQLHRSLGSNKIK